MDNPEKYQYKRDEIICHCGAEVDEYFALSSNSRRAVLREMGIRKHLKNGGREHGSDNGLFA